MKTTWIVFVKELTDACRDRRSILSASMFAVWAPAAVAIALAAMAREQSPDRVIRVAIEQRTDAPVLRSFLSQQTRMVIVDSVSSADDVRTGRADVGIRLPEDFGVRIEAAQPAAVDVFSDSTRTGSSGAAQRVTGLLSAYGRQLAAARLVLRGVAPDVAQPLRLQERDIASARSRSGRLLATLTVFLLVVTFVGGMGPAIDAIAGERERGSLESLLLHPARPLHLVAGKWGAAAGINVAVLALMMIVTAAVLRLPAVNALDVPIGLSGLEAVTAIGILLPLALLAPALQMLVSVFATSYKEAQTQASLLLFVPMVPGFMIALGTMQDTVWGRIAPVVSQQLYVADVLAGRPVQWLPLLAGAMVTLALTLLALRRAAVLLPRLRVARVRGQE